MFQKTFRTTKLLIFLVLNVGLITSVSAASLDDGIKAYKARNYRQAFGILMPLAKKGDKKAQLVIGGMYNSGYGVNKNEKEAFKWWLKSADQGYYAAQFNVGEAYIHGTGVSKDIKKAVYWYRKAAMRGYAMAQYYMGIAYLKGEGVEKNRRLSLEWFIKAAKQKHVSSQYHAGLIFIAGDIPKNEKEGMRWMMMAAKNGSKDAVMVLVKGYSNGWWGLPRDINKANYWSGKL